MKRAFGYLLALIPVGYAFAYAGERKRAFYWLLAASSLTVLYRVVMSMAAVHVLVPVFFLLLIPSLAALLAVHTVSAFRTVRRANRFRLVPLLVYLLVSIPVATGLDYLGDSYLARSWVIPGASMEPNLFPGERFYVRALEKGRPPVRGTMRVLVSPANPDARFVKRVVAVAGDRVKVVHGQLWVNGEKKTKANREVSDAGEYFITPDASLEPSLSWEGTIPEGHVFVLGDNRGHSFDSREFGPLGEDKLLGLPLFVWWGRTGATLQPRSRRLAE